MTGTVINFEPRVGKRWGALSSALGLILVVVAFWVLFLQLSAANYLFRIQQLLEDGASKADRDPSLASSARTEIWTSTSIQLVSTIKDDPPIEPKDVTNEELSASVQVPKAICFITTEYADEVHMVDKLSEPALANHTGFRHFLFTNLPDLKPTGWTQVVTSLNFSNHIIESRYAKFLGWKFLEIQETCRVVIYVDGIYKTSDRPHIFEKVAKHVLNKPSNLPSHERPGWMQFPHNLNHEGPLGELIGIEKRRKDTKEHVRQTAHWLYSNVPSSVDNATQWLFDIPVYLNTWIAYDPRSSHFQRQTEDFWSVYANGTISWRDQPMWAYFVQKHGKKPLRFPGRPKTYFELQGKAKGFGGHKYVA